MVKKLLQMVGTIRDRIENTTRIPADRLEW